MSKTTYADPPEPDGTEPERRTAQGASIGSTTYPVPMPKWPTDLSGSGITITNVDDERHAELMDALARIEAHLDTASISVREVERSAADTARAVETLVKIFSPPGDAATSAAPSSLDHRAGVSGVEGEEPADAATGDLSAPAVREAGGGDGRGVSRYRPAAVPPDAPAGPPRGDDLPPRGPLA